jgi:hypothetical protein
MVKTRLRTADRTNAAARRRTAAARQTRSGKPASLRCAQLRTQLHLAMHRLHVYASIHAAERVSAGRRDHMARVHVDDATWQAFKSAAGQTPISELLGR